jgi:uncharacterized protein YhjY with autotransporter beta-barrel domain
MHIDTRSLRSCGSALRILTIACALGATVTSPARAQSLPPQVLPTLDEQVLFYLGNNCFNLDPAGDGGFGNNLSIICGYPSGVPATAGGGASSPQGSTLSLQNSVIQERLKRAKKKKDKDKDESAAAAGGTRGRSGKGHADASDTSAGTGTVSASSGFDIFASGSFESLDRNVTPFEDGYDSSVLGGAFGFDYQFNDMVVAGAVLGYRQQDADFKGGGDFTMKAFEPSIYVSVLPSPKTFLQFVAGYGGQNSDVNRAVHFEVIGSGAFVDGTAASAGDANAYNASAQFGFDQPAGRFTYGPRVGINYAQTKIDPYTETGITGLELRIDGRTVKSFQAVAAFYGSWAISTKGAVILPQFNVGYVHEFEDDASIVTAQFAEDIRPTPTTFFFGTSVPDSDFFNIEAGVSTVFARGIQFFVNLRTMVGNDNFDNTGATIGIRFEL